MFNVEASWATEPKFYRAPWPRGGEWEPSPYQHAGVEYSLARNNSVIGDQPGLGKTCEGVLISNAIEADSTLVVCPASLILNWEREIRMWSDEPDLTVYPITKSKNGVSHLSNYVILSYDMLRNDGIFAAIKAKLWDHLILDECHYVKDVKGNQRVARMLGKGGVAEVCGRKTLMSGTLMPNGPIEAYNAIRLCDWEAINKASLDDFKEAYYDFGEGWVNIYNKKTGEWEKKWSDHVRNVPMNHRDLQHRLRSRIMVRRLTEQVLTQLPERRWHPFPLAITTAIKKALQHPGWKQVEQLYEIDPTTFVSDIPVDGAIATARRLLGEAKAPSVADYIEELLLSGVRKVVVSAHHRSVLAYLRDRLAPHGLVYMDGSTSIKNKQAAVDQFQGDDRVTTILGQRQPLGEGWTLTAAQDAVLAEFDWTPGNNEQLFRRIWRRGQEGAYTIAHIPTVPGTLDERIFGRAVAKDTHIFQAMDDRG